MVDEVSEFCELMQNFGQTMCKATSERTIDTPWSIYSENWKLPEFLWKLPKILQCIPSVVITICHGIISSCI